MILKLWLLKGTVNEITVNIHADIKIHCLQGRVRTLFIGYIPHIRHSELQMHKQAHTLYNY